MPDLQATDAVVNLGDTRTTGNSIKVKTKCNRDDAIENKTLRADIVIVFACNFLEVRVSPSICIPGGLMSKHPYISHDPRQNAVISFLKVPCGVCWVRRSFNRIARAARELKLVIAGTWPGHYAPLSPRARRVPRQRVLGHCHSPTPMHPHDVKIQLKIREARVKSPPNHPDLTSSCPARRRTSPHAPT